MDFMKVFDQTLREIKREVNLKVLKVPEIEQKVLDATDDEPWGPHGSALAEIAQATKKFTECQIVMNVLWTRLTETGRNWRYVYKALAVIEYLVANGSERAVDDIIEHTFQISSLSSFEYVEPSGKDLGLNVRKKSENIVSLLSDKDKIQEARNKASANREKYVGLSSAGITYKSGSASFSSSNFPSRERYGGFESKRDGGFRDDYKDREPYGKGRLERDTASDDQENSSKKGSSHIKNHDKLSSEGSKSAKTSDSDKRTSVPLQICTPPTKYEDDFDDFDPRGTSSDKPAAASSIESDLFGQSLVGDLLHVPAPPPEMSVSTNNSSEIDLFADDAFVSASPQTESGAISVAQTKIELFASQPASSYAVSSTIDFFMTDPVVQPEMASSNSEPTAIKAVDPFASMPLNNFDGYDLFGAFTSNADLVSNESTQKSFDGDSHNNVDEKSPSHVSANKKSPSGSIPPPNKDSFQVKSGIWADSLSRGLIDLNITAPKKVNLADVGIVGGLTDVSEEKEKGPPLPSLYMGKAMGTGSGLGRSGFSPTARGGDDIFSDFSSQKYQFGNVKK